MSKIVRYVGVGTGLLLAGVGSAQAAISSALPADLATDQATVTGDVAGAGAVVIAIVLTVMGVRRVIGMFR